MQTKCFTKDIYAPSLSTAKKIEVTVSLPWQCDRQVHRENIGGTTEEYYRRSIYVPYMDSLIQPLKTASQKPIHLHVRYTSCFKPSWKKLTVQSKKHMVQTIEQFYSFGNFEQKPCRGMTCRNKDYLLSLKI